MIGLLYWLLSAIFREVNLGRNRLRRPKQFYTTPKTHADTARWVIRYTNQGQGQSQSAVAVPLSRVTVGRPRP